MFPLRPATPHLYLSAAICPPTQDERARKADNLQRSQMEQMSQQGGYGYPYGQQQPQQGMMPGMMSPWGMPWGMQPQMSQYGGYGGQMDPQAQMVRRLGSAIRTYRKG